MYGLKSHRAIRTRARDTRHSDTRARARARAMASSISHIPAVVSSPALIAALLSFSIAQTAKVFTHYHATGKVDYTRLVGSGGMPSSHTALVVGLCTSIGLKEGMQSSIFALCLVFSLVVRVCVCARVCVERAGVARAGVISRFARSLAMRRCVGYESARGVDLASSAFAFAARCACWGWIWYSFCARARVPELATNVERLA